MTGGLGNDSGDDFDLDLLGDHNNASNDPNNPYDPHNIYTYNKPVRR